MRAHMNLLVNSVLRRLEHDLIDVAPAPVFAWLEGLDDRVIARMEVFGRVLVLRGVATADMPTDEAFA
jgi:hypothetical protein